MVNPLAHATAHQGATERVSPRPIEPEQREQLDDLLGVQELTGRTVKNSPDRRVWVGRPLASEADGLMSSRHRARCSRSSLSHWQANVGPPVEARSGIASSSMSVATVQAGDCSLAGLAAR